MTATDPRMSRGLGKEDLKETIHFAVKRYLETDGDPIEPGIDQRRLQIVVTEVTEILERRGKL